jgi:hypothetical protein
MAMDMILRSVPSVRVQVGAQGALIFLQPDSGALSRLGFWEDRNVEEGSDFLSERLDVPPRSDR